jgi:hypothetical protein
LLLLHMSLIYLLLALNYKEKLNINNIWHCLFLETCSLLYIYIYIYIYIRGDHNATRASHWCGWSKIRLIIFGKKC